MYWIDVHAMDDCCLVTTLLVVASVALLDDSNKDKQLVTVANIIKNFKQQKKGKVTELIIIITVDFYIFHLYKFKNIFKNINLIISL